MFESKSFGNEEDIERLLYGRGESIKTLISVNPAYEWLIENIGNSNYRLIKAFITNIVPLESEGKRYFKKLAHKRIGFTSELWKLYNKIDKLNQEGKIRPTTYLELYRLGYTGICLGGKCPVDDIIEYL